MILNESNNGLIKIINNKVFKSSILDTDNNDSIFYEYLVSYYIKKSIINHVPFNIFIKANKLYFFETLEDKHKYFNLNNKKVIKPEELSNKQILDLDNLKYFCEYKDYLLLELEYIKNIGNIEDFIRSKYKNLTFVNDIIIILFMIYSSLNYLNNKYTHYDLGSYNVLIIEDPTIKTYKYYDKITNKTYIFKTKYRPKIIDYATSFISNINPIMKDKLCITKECTFNKNNKYCGDDGGIQFYNKTGEFDPKLFYRNSFYYSCSHDLYLVSMIKPILLEKLDKLDKLEKLEKLENNNSDLALKLKHILKKLFYKTKHGSPPIKYINNKIGNIMQMHEELLKLIQML